MNYKIEYDDGWLRTGNMLFTSITMRKKSPLRCITNVIEFSYRSGEFDTVEVKNITITVNKINTAL